LSHLLAIRSPCAYECIVGGQYVSGTQLYCSALKRSTQA